MPQEPDPEHHDLIDEPALPRMGLSSATLAAIFLGGALGTVARYFLDTALTTSPGRFPWATLLINLIGSACIGLLIPLTEHVHVRLPLARPFLVIGILGGWTTYSALAVDGIQLAQHGHALSTIGYLAGTVIGGLVAVLAGNSLGHRVVRP
jgi:CrcB protein